MSDLFLLQDSRSYVGSNLQFWKVGGGYTTNIEQAERFSMAKMMLAGTLSMAEIAFDCGFASQSHFTTSFRQMTGVTPTAWRTSCG